MTSIEELEVPLRETEVEVVEVVEEVDRVELDDAHGD
jgi:hypothetical protein